VTTITTRYHGPTNTRGARVTASDEDNRITLSWDHEVGSQENHDAAARALCVKLDWVSHDLYRGATKRGYVYVFAAPAERIAFTAGERALAAQRRDQRIAAVRAQGWQVEIL
jgi:hypothetical protein